MIVLHNTIVKDVHTRAFFIHVFRGSILVIVFHVWQLEIRLTPEELTILVKQQLPFDAFIFNPKISYVIFF